MPLPATDAFTGTGALSASWTAGNGASTRVSDVVVVSAAASDTFYWWNADAFANDQYSKLTISDVIADVETFGWVCRASGAAATLNCYFIYTDGANDAGTQYCKIINGVATALGNIGSAFAQGDVVKLKCSGTGATFRLEVFKSDVSVGTPYTTSDSSHTSGATGFYQDSHAGPFAADQKSRMDDFEGGNLAEAIPSVPVPRVYYPLRGRSR